MNTITCTSCGKQIEVDKALEGQIEARVLAAKQHEHEAELQKVRQEAELTAKKERDQASERLKKQIESEKELLQQQAKDDLELARRKLEMEMTSAQKKAAGEQELLIKSLRDDAAAEKEASKQLREQLSELMKNLSAEKRARENAELEAEKKLALSEEKIREEVGRQADEKQRLNLAAKEKTITDLQKALDEAQRKAAQGSQQLQGEIMELDFEAALADAFRDDEIKPVAKGVNGADISHLVKSPRGTQCGIILWEIKRTKNWVDGWVPKLKEDMRSAKANIPVIITESMPKHLTDEIGQVDGVWVCKPKQAIILATLLRKGLLDVGYQKALMQNQGGKAEALFSFVTSHEFIQQVESMVETYSDMTAQVTKERVAYEKMWAQREKQAQKLLLSTANIIGSMQGHIGHASMPKIKGLELSAEEDELAQLTLG